MPSWLRLSYWDFFALYFDSTPKLEISHISKLYSLSDSNNKDFKISFGGKDLIKNNQNVYLLEVDIKNNSFFNFNDLVNPYVIKLIDSDYSFISQPEFVLGSSEIKLLKEASANEIEHFLLKKLKRRSHVKIKMHIKGPAQRLPQIFYRINNGAYLNLKNPKGDIKKESYISKIFNGSLLVNLIRILLIPLYSFLIYIIICLLLIVISYLWDQRENSKVIFILTFISLVITIPPFLIKREDLFQPGLEFSITSQQFLDLNNLGINDIELIHKNQQISNLNPIMRLDIEAETFYGGSINIQSFDSKYPLRIDFKNFNILGLDFSSSNKYFNTTMPVSYSERSLIFTPFILNSDDVMNFSIVGYFSADDNQTFYSGKISDIGFIGEKKRSSILNHLISIFGDSPLIVIIRLFLYGLTGLILFVHLGTEYEYVIPIFFARMRARSHLKKIGVKDKKRLKGLAGFFSYSTGQGIRNLIEELEWFPQSKSHPP